MMALLALTSGSSFQFLGIPPKGEHSSDDDYNYYDPASKFPISRDPPEGGTSHRAWGVPRGAGSFQFLGIPPKGEL